MCQVVKTLVYLFVSKLDVFFHWVHYRWDYQVHHYVTLTEIKMTSSISTGLPPDRWINTSENWLLCPVMAAFFTIMALKVALLKIHIHVYELPTSVALIMRSRSNWFCVTSGLVMVHLKLKNASLYLKMVNSSEVFFLSICKVRKSDISVLQKRKFGTLEFLEGNIS